MRRDISTMVWALLGGLVMGEHPGEAGCAPQCPSSFPWGGSLEWWLCATGTADMGLCCSHGHVPVSVQLMRHKSLSYSHGYLLKPLSLPQIQRQEMFPQGGFCTQGSWSNQEWCLSPDLLRAAGGALAWPHARMGSCYSPPALNGAVVGRAVCQDGQGRDRGCGQDRQ